MSNRLGDPIVERWERAMDAAGECYDDPGPEDYERTEQWLQDVDYG